MLRWVVLWQAVLVLVSGTFNFGLFTPKQQLTPMAAMNCFEYSKFSPDKIRRVHNEGWRHKRNFAQNVYTGISLPAKRKTSKTFSHRIDTFKTTPNDILREHAKLVQDINGLRQYALVAPITDQHKDYDESIYHEVIETSSIPAVAKTLKKPNKQDSFPIILAGGASNHNEIKKNPVQMKTIVNLVGTTISPVKHPYPFVQTTVVRPIRICMPSLSSTYATTTEQPSLWQKILRAIIPR